LIINYVGQGAWLLANYQGQGFDVSQLNAFYGIMPQGFRIIGIAIATAAAIIASQALISGSFTLISEAMRLNLWPKVKIRYPSEERGQVYIRAINFLLYFGCVAVVLYFQRSSKMEGAYGLAITLCMIATSILFANFLVLRRTNPILVYLYLAVYFAIEISFLIANLEKFPHGGYVASIVGG
jgi:KUP system potassium uptake protein